jgi:hypothetical protein
MEEKPSPDRPRRRWVGPIALVATGLIAGGLLASTLTAGAQTGSPTAVTSGAHDARGATGGETLLTGSTAQKVEEAALAAVPNGTIIRVKTDSDGSPYEAHVQKSNGDEVVVKVDENFNVTGIETCDRGSDQTN